MFRGLGFTDVLKLDGGGSYYQSRDGAASRAAENRRINSVLRWTEREERPELTEEQAWFDRMMEDWMTRKAKEPASQWAQEVWSRQSQWHYRRNQTPHWRPGKRWR